MFSSMQSIPGLTFASSDVKVKIRPGVEAIESASCMHSYTHYKTGPNISTKKTWFWQTCKLEY